MFLDAFHKGAAERADAELADHQATLRTAIEQYRPAASPYEITLPWKEIPDPRGKASQILGTLSVQPILSFGNNSCSLFIYGKRPEGGEDVIGQVHFFDTIEEIERPDPVLNVNLGGGEADASWRSANALLFLQLATSAIEN